MTWYRYVNTYLWEIVGWCGIPGTLQYDNISVHLTLRPSRAHSLTAHTAYRRQAIVPPPRLPLHLGPARLLGPFSPA